jgi:hypothetical protein
MLLRYSISLLYALHQTKSSRLAKLPFLCQPIPSQQRYNIVPGRFRVHVSNHKEITMKQFIAIIAAAFAVSAFAQTKPAEAPKAAPAAAPAASAPAAPAKKDEPKKADVKSEKAGDKKAEAAKK